VLVSSFTKAAATEIASRGVSVDRKNIGTLHAICYHLLNEPDLTESKLKDWNIYAPQLALFNAKADIDDPYATKTQSENDEQFLEIQRLRARMIPIELWNSRLQFFYKKWNEWKKESGLLDFEDLLQHCYLDFDNPPNNCTVGFFDEAQDFTLSQISLVRKWADKMYHALLAGDDDQMIFGFTGATTEAFLLPEIPNNQKEILTQSYRVPIKIHRLSEQIVKKLSYRENKEYLPRDYEGNISLNNSDFKHPEKLLNVIDKYLAKDKTVMILGACSYHIEPMRAVLKKNGYPFHNPYRLKRGDWNPISRRKNAVMSFERLLAFLNPFAGDPDLKFWTPSQLESWIHHFDAKNGLIRGAKKGIANLGLGAGNYKNYVGFAEAMSRFFKEDKLFELFDLMDDELTIKWFLDNILDSKKGLYKYPINVIKKFGQETLKDKPKITIGTIHSVKGGESDAVILFPDLSANGYRQWIRHGDSKDQIIRQFYVAITRAKEDLIICNPATPFYFETSMKGIL